MSEPVRWGLLSTARINEKLLVGAGLTDQVDVIGVASRDSGKAAKYARERGIERSYGSYEAMLADPDIEAVYISLPNGMHIDWSLRCLAAGKHVLVEKPLSGSVAEVEHAFDAADAAGLLMMEAFMYRHNPQMTRLVELIAEGAIGRPRVISTTFGFHIDDPTDVRLSTAMAGGALMDVGCYCVSAARLLGGEPERVHGEQVLGGDGVDIVFSGVLRFADDLLAHFDCGLMLNQTEGVTVLGEDGAMHIADPWHCRNPGIELRRPGGTEAIAVDTVNSYKLELESLSAGIRGTGTPLLGRDDAVGQARTIEALYASAAQHETVTL